jgi:amino acid adenylation domain-containing protein
MEDTGAGLEGILIYNPDLFDAITIGRMLSHFKLLLEGIAADPEQRLLQLSFLSQAEWNRLLVEWNDSGANYPHGRTLHELFEDQVERTPDAVAVVFEDHLLTYRQLDCRANQLAHHLGRTGVGPETLVGICVERSMEMVVGLLGILKAGGAYVPLDPTYPRERIDFMASDAGTTVLLTQERLVGAQPDLDVHLVCLDSDWTNIARESLDTAVGDGVTAANLAYVIYTSGSTGKPKGAMNTHRGVCNRLLWMQEAYQLTAVDRVLQKTPFSFDVSVWEFFWPLLTGACLVMARPEGHKDSAYLIETIVAQGITTMHFVPSMLRVFLQGEGLDACNSLKRVVCSGEALSTDLQARFFACLNAELHNLYGPTEAAVDVTFWPCERESERRVVPIGRPIANIQVYLLDAYLEPVPIGVPGELHIGGVGLARGYHNRPGLTATKFVPNPFSAEPGDRLYKTGDLARYLADGNVEFLGRTDHQVKVRGFRIELGEIEAALTRHPAVRETAVLAREDRPGDKRLVAYLVPTNGREPTVSEIRRFLREGLPEYMVPAIFVMLDTLPLTPNGKIDRRALPLPERVRPTVEQDFVPPRTQVEEILVRIWAEILDIEQVGVHDNFFEVGGDSLLIMPMIARAEQEGLHLAPQQVFQHQTISELAAVEAKASVQAERESLAGDASVNAPDAESH